MLIQCLIPRRTGTPVTLSDGTKISFQPNKQGDHVCEVKEKEHIKQLLGHKGVYRPYNAEESQLEKEAEEAERLRKEQEAAANKDKKPLVDGEKTGEKTCQDDDPGPGDDKAWTEESLNAMDDNALRDLFEKVVGTKPHHKIAKEKIVKALLANQEHKTEPGNE
jgi:hypothetical protein